MAELKFEEVSSNRFNIFRAKVLGGWIVVTVSNVWTESQYNQLYGEGFEWRESLTFIPDPLGLWK